MLLQITNVLNNYSPIQKTIANQTKQKLSPIIAKVFLLLNYDRNPSFQRNNSIKPQATLKQISETFQISY